MHKQNIGQTHQKHRANISCPPAAVILPCAGVGHWLGHPMKGRSICSSGCAPKATLPAVCRELQLTPARLMAGDYLLPWAVGVQLVGNDQVNYSLKQAKRGLSNWESFLSSPLPSSWEYVQGKNPWACHRRLSNHTFFSHRYLIAHSTEGEPKQR